MSDLKLFPAEVSIPPLATAILERIDRNQEDVVAHYRLAPDDGPVFRARIESDDDLLDRRYEPMFGVWSLLKKSDDDHFMLLGVRQVYGRSLVGAIRKNNRSCETMIPPYQVKAQLLGFLADNGV